MESVPPQIPAFELGKHMAKLTLKDEGVVLLRPRYELDAKKREMYSKAINLIGKACGKRVQFVLLPHDIDVFVVDKGPSQDATPTVGEADKVEGVES